MNCTKTIKQRHTDFNPKIALVLGSGLGEFTDSIEKLEVIPYSEL